MVKHLFYLAQPYTGCEQQAFELAQKVVARQMGPYNNVFSPILFSHTLEALDCEYRPSFLDYLDFDRVMMEALKDDIKAVLFLPGWEHSTGCNWEYKWAQELGIECRTATAVNGNLCVGEIIKEKKCGIEVFLDE